jgi:hypothetical protein
MVGHNNREYVVHVPFELPYHPPPFDVPYFESPLLLLVLPGRDEHIITPIGHGEGIDILTVVEGLDELVLTITLQSNQFDVALPIPRGYDLSTYLAESPYLTLVEVPRVCKEFRIEVSSQV